MEKDTIDFIKKYNDVIGNPFPENSMYSATRLINTLHRFKSIMNDNCPALSLGEWCACAETGAQYDLNINPGKQSDIAVIYGFANIEDSPQECKKWGVDNIKLAKKIKNMTYTQQCALYEVIVTFWSLQNRTELKKLKELFAYCGANISD